MLQNLFPFFTSDEGRHCLEPVDDLEWVDGGVNKTPKKRDLSNRPVGIGLPRQATFRRQNSEKRDRLCPIDPDPAERRAYSASRHASTNLATVRSRSTPPSLPPTRNSAPTISTNWSVSDSGQPGADINVDAVNDATTNQTVDNTHDTEPTRADRPPSITSTTGSYERQRYQLDERAQLNAELDTRWILNLSMRFRDKSDREKFFVTYAEVVNKWRRVTVSCDYRNAEPASLEMDLRELTYQRDKSLQIYESIRESLAEIQFYDTVTNLKLETTEGRLHVHVTEDVNEIIPYPPRSSIAHLLQDERYQPMEVRESDLSFDSHLSGFVYKVRHRGRVYIKKEIPGPDTVDEFLYEVNALHALHDSENVIRLEGIVLDETQEKVKGLLISYAERGAVVDLLYDHKGEIPWADRERWARNAVKGLSEIHEEGYVQGDFTLSNIVVDHENNARIIDINRRGCPVGWEPPELAKKIASNQRISMYIGEKSDLYQLGMTLWALAMDDDEPERHDPPLSTQEFPADVPEWYQTIVRICLSPRPRDRMSAKELLTIFPQDIFPSVPARTERPLVRLRTEKQYIDPQAAVERDDLERFRFSRDNSEAARYSPESSREDYTFTYPRSSEYDHDYDSDNSEVERPRGRRRISDHDRLLRAQAQARGHQVLVNGRSTPHIIMREPDEPFCYEVDSNGQPRYLTESADEAHHRALQQHELLRSERLSSSNPDEHFTDRINQDYLRPYDFELQAHSDHSDGTPRNSCLQLEPPDIAEEQQAPSSSTIDKLPDELACLGSRPDFSTYSAEPYEPNTQPVILEEGSTRNHPRLAFADSGYNEPDYFGAEREIEETSDPRDDDAKNDFDSFTPEPALQTPLEIQETEIEHLHPTVQASELLPEVSEDKSNSQQSVIASDQSFAGHTAEDGNIVDDKHKEVPNAT